MTLPSAGDWLWPDWRPHPRVRVAVTTRLGNHSAPPLHGFNLGTRCGDDPQRVERARQHVHRLLATDHPPVWLEQVHGNRVVHAGETGLEADGAWSDEPEWPCAVLTADCLPVLMARRDGTAVGAFHAGWRGLHGGILEAGVRTLAPAGEPLAAWLGPAIGQSAYQVGQEVREAFVRDDPAAEEAFMPDTPGHWRMSLVKLAVLRLQRAGVEQVAGGEYCTVARGDLFYSHRHEGRTGRFASLIWISHG